MKPDAPPSGALRPWQRCTASHGFVDAGSAATVDPLLWWADATGFADFRRAGETLPEAVVVLVELCDGRTPADLAAALGDPGAVRGGYLGLATRYCTALFSAPACRRFARPDNGVVLRFELALPVVPRRVPARRAAPATTAGAAAAAGIGAAGAMPAGDGLPRAQGALLLGVVDTGCVFAHAALRRPGGGTRVLNLWDQDAQPAFGAAPARGQASAFDRGRVLTRDELDALMRAHTLPGGTVDEDACYEAAAYPELRRSLVHGAMVVDQLAGPLRQGARLARDGHGAPDWQRSPAPSTQADLVFVQLARDAWGDPNGNALGASVLDGLRHIQSCAGPATRRIVVNISCAHYSGPHNGSSVLDAALAELCTPPPRGSPGAAAGPAPTVCLPAGNAFDARWHAQGALAPGQADGVQLRVPPGTESPTLLQAWVDAPPASLRWRLQAPDGRTLTLAAAAEPWSLDDARGQPLAWVVATASTARGRAGAADRGSTLLLLALAPAASPDHAGAAGDWRLQVAGDQAATLRVYLARNESDLGAPLRHRPARLLDAAYDPQRFHRARQDDPLPPDPGVRVRRRGTLSGAACGPGVVTVAAHRLRPLAQPSRYSSAGPPAPALSAVGDESPALAGLRAAGSRSACVVRLQGTSFSAPLVARHLADTPAAAPAPHGPDPDRAGVPRLPL